METKYVKILGSKSPSLWYRDRIGQIFPVCSESAGYYCVMQTTYSILKEDCEPYEFPKQGLTEEQERALVDAYNALQSEHYALNLRDAFPDVLTAPTYKVGDRFRNEKGEEAILIQLKYGKVMLYCLNQNIPYCDELVVGNSNSITQEELEQLTGYEYKLTKIS